MELTKDMLRQAAQILAKGGVEGPYYVSLVKNGVPFWVWVDAEGNFVPPPQTCYQPTVA